MQSSSRQPRVPHKSHRRHAMQHIAAFRSRASPLPASERRGVVSFQRQIFRRPGQGALSLAPRRQVAAALRGGVLRIWETSSESSAFGVRASPVQHGLYAVMHSRCGDRGCSCSASTSGSHTGSGCFAAVLGGGSSSGVAPHSSSCGARARRTQGRHWQRLAPIGAGGAGSGSGRQSVDSDEVRWPVKTAHCAMRM